MPRSRVPGWRRELPRGSCLGCRLYGLHWFLPELFDRVVLRQPAQPRIRFRSQGELTAARGVRGLAP